MGLSILENKLMKQFWHKAEEKIHTLLCLSKDTSGHGTGVAGIIGAGGRAGVTGAAPECEFVIVKLKVANRAVLGQFPEILTIIPQYQSSDVLMALKYLYETQRRLNKPMVICVAIGSNYGGHDGTAHVERYIDFFTYRSQIAIVGGTGNEGDAANHTSGKFTESGETIIIELQVADDQIGIEVNLWFNKPDKISVGIISPSGEALERIPEQIEELSNLKFTLEGTTVSVLCMIIMHLSLEMSMYLLNLTILEAVYGK